MLCERCNKKKATVFYRENIGGRIKAMRLCGECAELLEQAGELEDISATVAGWLSPVFLMDDLFNLPFHSFIQTDEKTDPSSPTECPTCGISFQDILRIGKVGCPGCYKAFSDELTHAIRAVHGNVSHMGRVSSGYRAHMEKLEQLNRLKKQLKEAVAEEKYEVAVGLRDKIRSLETTL